MAIIDKKQTRWYSKSTFDSLDKTTIPVGTEIQVTGEIEETDLTADLQTKINGKLTTPTTPTADSVVTMAANGTTGTKALSEFGGKLYRHIITIYNTNYSNVCNIYAYFSNDTSINSQELLFQHSLQLEGCNVVVKFGEDTRFIGFYNYLDNDFNRLYINDYQNVLKHIDISGLEYSDTVIEL